MRQVLMVALGWCLAGMGEAAAEDLAALRPAQRKAAIEKKLDEPLEWDLAGREQVTLEEFIEFVQEKHGLKIRWDAGSLALFQGQQGPLMGLVPMPASQPTYYATPYASDPLATPPPLPANVPSNPYPSEPAKPEAAPDKPQPAVPDPYERPQSAPSPYAPSPTAPSKDAAASSPGSPATGKPYAGPLPPPLSPPLPPAPHVAAPVVAGPEGGGAATKGVEELIASYGEAPLAVSALSLEHATVREGLKQLLDALPTAAGAAFSIGIPITTRALNLDLLVDENSVLITTQLRANAAKEIRVYRLGALSETPPETLVRVITHTVRPWSWRSQVHEIAEQLASRWPKTPLPLPKVEINMTEGVKLASSEAGAGAPQPAATFPSASEETVAATGQLLAGGAVAAVDSVVAALEIVHHGDPPTGVIEVLPGMLVITQSQGAHREIEALLDALRDGSP